MKKIIILLMSIVLLQVAVSAQTKRATVSSLLNQFENASQGLVFMSETDSDVHNFISPKMGQILTIEEFRNATLAGDVVIQEIDADTWFQARSNGSMGWINLHNLLTRHLQQITVYKVGTIEVEYYVVGIYDNRFIGIKTFGIET